MQTLPSARYTGKGQPRYSSLRQAALEYANEGWAVFPLHTPTLSCCSCKKTACDKIGKHPRNRNGLKEASSDKDTVFAWWERWPTANIAIATGPESGLWVLDIDEDEGAASVRELCREHGKEWLKTLTATTGRGKHLYFCYPANQKIGTRTGVKSGLDVRGEGGYIVAPGSAHVSGRRYEWVNPNIPIAVAPEWLLQLITMKKLKRSSEQTICKGTRHDTFLRSAGRMRRLGMEPRAIEATLLHEQAPLCVSPMTVARRIDTRKIADSIGKLSIEVESADALPLEDFVAAAITFNKTQYEVWLNSDQKSWRSQLFYFVRKLKSRTEFAGKDAVFAANLLGTVLSKSSGSVVGFWERYFGELHDDPYTLFVETWDDVKLGESDSPLQDAYNKALKRLLFPSNPESDSFSRFISVVGHRQRSTPGVPIPISGKAFGELLGYHHTTISLHLKHARKLNLLTQVKESSYIKGVASEYLFPVEQWDWDSGHQV